MRYVCPPLAQDYAGRLVNRLPRIPWSFFLALAVLLIGCGLLGYALGFSLVVTSVKHGRSG